MRVGDFLKGAPPSEPVAPTYPLGVNECDLKKLLPPAAVEMMRRALPAFGRKLRGFDGAGAILTGVETRTSSPVRILRGESLEAVGTQGLYPTGEGAGYAGGIMSAAVDGLRVAERLIERYRAPGGGRRHKKGARRPRPGFSGLFSLIFFLQTAKRPPDSFDYECGNGAVLAANRVFHPFDEIVRKADGFIGRRRNGRDFKLFHGNHPALRRYCTYYVMFL